MAGAGFDARLGGIVQVPDPPPKGGGDLGDPHLNMYDGPALKPWVQAPTVSLIFGPYAAIGGYKRPWAAIGEGI